MYSPMAPATGTGLLATSAGYTLDVTWLIILGMVLMTVSLMLWSSGRLFLGEHRLRQERAAASAATGNTRHGRHPAMLGPRIMAKTIRKSSNFLWRQLRR